MRTEEVAEDPSVFDCLPERTPPESEYRIPLTGKEFDRAVRKLIDMAIMTKAQARVLLARATNPEWTMSQVATHFGLCPSVCYTHWKRGIIELRKLDPNAVRRCLGLD